MSLITSIIANGTYTSAQIQEHVDRQERAVQRAQDNEDYYRTENKKKDEIITKLIKRLKMSSFLATLHTEKEFKQFAECCDIYVTRSQFGAVTQDMIASPDSYLMFISDYKKIMEKRKKGVNRNGKRPYRAQTYCDIEDLDEVDAPYPQDGSIDLS